MKFLYRPDHPQADEFGFVPAEIAYMDRKWHPAIISDTMQPLKHMGTGRIIDSKSKFRAETKAGGWIETGNETIAPRTPVKLDRRQRREDIKRAIDELRNGKHG